MMTSGTIRTLAILLATLPAWAPLTPAHAQMRRGGGGGGGGGGLSGRGGFSNFANQFMPSFGNTNTMRQPGTYPRALPPLGGSSMGGIQGQRGGNQGVVPFVGPSSTGGFNRPGNFNYSGLSNAFGGPSPSSYPSPTSYAAPYQAAQGPSQYQDQADSSTWPQQTRSATGGPVVGQRYQVPAEYASYPAGSVIRWGKYRYLIGDDGTMTWTSRAVTAAASPATDSAEPDSDGGPVPGKRYQIPAEHARTAPGTQITYAGYHYVTNTDGTMTAFHATAEKDDQAPTGPIPGKRYQIPSEHAKAAPGSLVTYAGYQYVANTDGTMTAFTPPEETKSP